jgi:release factor glutamine methyltransferase
VSSLSVLIGAAAVRLSAAGVPSPRHDAEALAGHVLGVRRGQLPALANLTSRQAVAYDKLVTRRADREPLQHLTGRVGFRHLDLAVGPGVFIPRPETEVVVEWCLGGLPPGGTAVDLCAGSGAIALALAGEGAGAMVFAVEKDPAAYRWLQHNAVGTGVHCLPVDIAEIPSVVPHLLGAVDVVVSNPPYIPLGSQPLEPEVARYDPAVALWGGRDGLDVVRTVQRVARQLLACGGRLAIEHADSQGAAVPALLADAGGWTDVADHRDLTGRDRFATAVWAG